MGFKNYFTIIFTDFSSCFIPSIYIYIYNFLFLYSGQNEEELSCKQHDKVMILEALGDGWMRVKKGEEEGYVPESYVTVDKD